MKKLLSLLLLFVLNASLPATVQAQQSYIEGTHYTVMAAPKSVKKEVKEYFFYSCGHCFRAQSTFQSVKRSLPLDVTYTLVPAIRDAQMIEQAKAYYTAEALNVTDSIHPALYNEMFVKKQPLANARQISEVFQQFGIDKSKFNKVYNSFAVQGQVHQAKAAMRSHQIRSAPALIVNGIFQIIQPTRYNASQLSGLINYLLNKN